MKVDFLGRYEYPEMMNGAYELFVRTSRQFDGSILRGGSQNFGNRCGHGGRTSVMFTQTRCDRGEQNSTSGSNSSQVDPVLGKYEQLYRHTECFACHCYGNISGQCPNKKPK